MILRTDDHHWDQPDWYPDSVVSVDISGIMLADDDSHRALYVLLSSLGARRIFNVNSRLAFETFVTYGARLATQSNLYAYYFCSDRTAEGQEVGYPVWYFANTFPHLKAALTDTRDLAETLVRRFAVPAEEVRRVVTIYTPAQTPPAEPTMAERAARRAIMVQGRRPRILWAGRLDRQKRFDLVVAIARAMPEVDFLCRGKAVLDVPPDLAGLPPNLKMSPPFTRYDELPLAETEGWLYTSAWDGLPTILIELGARGVPIVASAVGGVPELIDQTTGWPVDEAAEVADYAAALRAMIGDRDERVRRGRALQDRVRQRHSAVAFAAAVAAL